MATELRAMGDGESRVSPYLRRPLRSYQEALRDVRQGRRHGNEPDSATSGPQSPAADGDEGDDVNTGEGKS